MVNYKILKLNNNIVFYIKENLHVNFDSNPMNNSSK